MVRERRIQRQEIKKIRFEKLCCGKKNGHQFVPVDSNKKQTKRQLARQTC
jgi:hypothetical protein